MGWEPGIFAVLTVPKKEVFVEGVLRVCKESEPLVQGLGLRSGF